MSDRPLSISDPQPLNITIIARHYPPEISGGARRPSLLAQGLRQAGHRVCVVSPQSDLQHPDDVHIPHPATSIAASSAEGPSPKEPKFRAWLRLWLLWPDPDIRWTRRVKTTLKTRPIPDIILTTSPPESTHYVGYALRKTNSLWIAEMRDGWINEPLRDSLRHFAFRRFIETKLARFWLKKADGIIAVSDTILSEAHKLAPEVPSIFIGHFAEPSADAEVFPGDGPHFLHTGRFSLSHPDRDIKSVLDGFKIAAGRFRSEARLHLVGELTQNEKDHIGGHDCHNQVMTYGALPMARARALQAGADILVLSQHEGATSIPGKHAEYLATGHPIAVVGNGPWRAAIQGGPVEELSKFSPQILEALSQSTPESHSEPGSFSVAIDEYMRFHQMLLSKISD